MAHPKRRQSHSRTHKRRTHDAISIPELVVCSECGRLKPAHMVCPFCGYYKGKEVVVVEFESKKKKKQ